MSYDKRTVPSPLRAWLTKLARGAVVALAAFIGPAAFAQNLDMAVAPVFTGFEPNYGFGAPMEVSLQNRGLDARGYVRVTGDEYSMEYPIELPRGARKRIVVYAQGSMLRSPSFALVTNRGGLEFEYRGIGEASMHSRAVGLVSDTTGELGFLSSLPGFVTGYVAPDRAPDRPVHYSHLEALVLGPGSERLSDEAARAIQNWVLGGGTVVLVGGASAPILSDPRWQALIPIRDAESVTSELRASLKDRYGPVEGRLSALVGSPSPGAVSKHGGYIVSRSFGLGKTVYLAMNPFEPPLNRWRGRPKLFSDVLSNQANVNTILVASGASSSARRYIPHSHLYSTASREQIGNNPFSTQLPPTTTVMAVLAAYFVAVVPLNFLLLRKLGRGHFAWFTAPVLSLVFAGVFFYAARGLYSADLSTSTDGVLILQEGYPEGLLVAHTQLFFPRSGRYNLQLKGVDQIRATSADDQPWRRDRRNEMAEMAPTDIGEVQVQAMGVPNLAFREIFFRQRVNAGSWLSVSVSGDKAVVVNASPYKVTSARLVHKQKLWPIPDMLSGQRQTVTLAEPAGQTFLYSSMDGAVASAVRTDGCIRLLCKMEGLRGGPQIGKETLTGQGIWVCVTTDDKVEG